MEVLRKGPKMFFIVECPECGSLLRGEEAEFHPVYGQAGALLEYTCPVCGKKRSVEPAEVRKSPWSAKNQKADASKERVAEVKRPDELRQDDSFADISKEFKELAKMWDRCFDPRS